MSLHRVSPNCALCSSCQYYKHQNSIWAACDYIGMEGHSRTFEGRKKRLKKGYCDKYKEKKRYVRYE